MYSSRKEHRKQGERLALWAASGAILYAPIAFGTTTPVTRYFLDGWMALTALILLVHRAGGNPLFIPRSLVAALGLLNLTGLLFLLNPKFTFNTSLDYFEPSPHALSWFPGTYDFESSWPEVVHFFALSLFLISLTQLCANHRHRWTLLKVIAVAGFLVAVIGIYQKASGSQSMLWTSNVYEERTFFAAFRYHGNAVAFLNLCWPASLALLLRTLCSPHRHFLATTWWSNSLLFTFGAVLVNTSKFGHVAAIPSALLALYLFRRRLPGIETGTRGSAVIVGILVVGFLTILSLFSAELISSRWESTLTNPLSFDRRLLAYNAAWKMLWEESQISGLGPGCFGLVFPYHSVFAGKELGGTWTFAHNDYLQLLIEWGIAGSASIFFVFGAAFSRLISKYRRSRAKSFSAAAALLACFVVAAHALVDFPLQIGAIQILVVVYLAIAWAPENATGHPTPGQ